MISPSRQAMLVFLSLILLSVFSTRFFVSAQRGNRLGWAPAEEGEEGNSITPRPGAHDDPGKHQG